MKKILTSTWFAAVIGVIAFCGVIVFLWKAKTPATAAAATGAGAENTNAPPHEAPTETPTEVPEPPIVQPTLATPAGLGGEPGALSFNNPEVNNLLLELRREKSALLQKEKELRQLEQQIKYQKQQLTELTQQVWKVRLDYLQSMTNTRVVISENERSNYRDLAMIFTNMPPQNAVLILDKKPSEEIARILSQMEDVWKARILENFATNELTQRSGKAHEVSAKLRDLHKIKEATEK